MDFHLASNIFRQTDRMTPGMTQLILRIGRETERMNTCGNEAAACVDIMLMLRTIRRSDRPSAGITLVLDMFQR